MARRSSGLARRVALALAGLVGVVCLGAAAWVAYTQAARATRETRTVEDLAAGRGRWVQVADAALYVQQWGDDRLPTVLLTHGTGAWSGTWFGLPAQLNAAGWHVVAVDVPPFGLSKPRSPGSTVDYSRVAQAQRLLQLMDTLGRPVTLVGHSFGAGPALEAAMRGGGRVRQLVLVDPALGLGPAGEPPHCDPDAGNGGPLAWRAVRTAAVAATATWPGLTGTLLKQFVHRKAAVTDELVPAYQLPFERVGFSAGLGDWALSFAHAACETAASLQPARLTAWSTSGPPVRLVWGAQDTITPLTQGHALKSWMPRATLDVIPGVGHIPHIEDSEAFAKALVQALGRPGP